VWKPIIGEDLIEDDLTCIDVHATTALKDIVDRVKLDNEGNERTSFQNVALIYKTHSVFLVNSGAYLVLLNRQSFDGFGFINSRGARYC
jgi:hypothetical protein